MGVLVTASAGCLLVIRHEHEHVVVHIGRPDAAATLSLCDSFVLADAVLRGAEVVSAVEVSDAPSGLAVIALAWRRRLASEARLVVGEQPAVADDLGRDRV